MTLSIIKNILPWLYWPGFQMNIKAVLNRIDNSEHLMSSEWLLYVLKKYFFVSFYYL